MCLRRDVVLTDPSQPVQIGRAREPKKITRGLDGGCHRDTMASFSLISAI